MTNQTEQKQPEQKQPEQKQSEQKQTDEKQGETHQETQQISEEGKTTVQVIAIFIFAWIILGLIALVWSIYCFGKSGSIFQKIVGILLAVFTGPLFFILYKYSPTYCK
jgi:uncharacterized ion transporter superfamily protein YfcC